MVRRIAELAATLAELDHSAALRIAEKLEKSADLAERFPDVPNQSRFEMKSS